MRGNLRGPALAGFAAEGIEAKRSRPVYRTLQPMFLLPRSLLTAFPVVHSA
jgi:hypothetical protein